MFSRILLATDGSDHSNKAFDYAVGLAKLLKAELIIVHAYAPIPALLGTPFYHTLLEPRLADGEKLLHELVATCEDTGITAYHDLMKGPPDVAILTAAETNDCDLIVMGALGHGETGSACLGSISYEVIRNATCPVLVVR